VDRKGEYLAICEGDDYWTDPLKLEKQLDLMQANPKMTFCFHGVETLKEANEMGIFLYLKILRTGRLNLNPILLQKEGEALGPLVLFKKGNILCVGTIF
jgi:hypothetical protein